MEAVLVLTYLKGRLLSLLYRDNRLVKASAYEQQESLLESIVIGKVKNILSSPDAAFVEYAPGKMGFLPMKNVMRPILLNRNFNGRLAAGDEIIVQIEKEGMKKKIPGLTCNLSFTGQYAVITTGNLKRGFSSKLGRGSKERIRQWLEEDPKLKLLEGNDSGIVIRTNAGMLEGPEQLLSEITYLVQKKQDLLEHGRHRTCFSVLYSPPPSYLMEIRDLYGFSYDRIVTDNEGIYTAVREAFPHQLNLSLYQDSQISLARLYRVETALKEATDEIVWLKSGAYLIIQPTDALTVIDVNSGKSQKRSRTPDSFLETNLEAAKEIALQLKLRNISGIIIVDFINQSSVDQDQLLLQELTRLVEEDPVKTSVVGMTALGLVEITRKKVNRPLWEQLATPQSHARK